ncbi:hypothetical protein [Acetobacter sp. P1H12_c]|uniref:hypothetical protein n=1 Tax=Acetobacter sp. P1H12_c TaxID=2762621 RepID=UPI001C048419|nr:hypothetical protein [Acetobacter sp. P1H12_c]
MISEKNSRELIESLCSNAEVAYRDNRPDREAAYREAIMMVQSAIVASRPEHKHHGLA